MDVVKTKRKPPGLTWWFTSEQPRRAVCGLVLNLLSQEGACL